MTFEIEFTESLSNPKNLEKLYRQNPEKFKTLLADACIQNPDSLLLNAWNERLNYISDGTVDVQQISDKYSNYTLIILLCSFAGIFIEAPKYLPFLEDSFFHSRNFSVSFLFPIAIYFLLKNKLGEMHRTLLFVSFLGALVYINALPNRHTDTLYLAALHLPFFLWSVVGIIYIGNEYKDFTKRMEYIRFNGEALIYTAIILICGMFLAGLTLALFSVIKVDIAKYYFEYVVVIGTVSSPIVAMYLAEMRKQTSKNLAPLIAKIFGPLVLITLIFYLLTILVLRKDPYNDREFLVAFNCMLLSVLAITVFTISERGQSNKILLGDYSNLALVICAIVIDLVALSAILFRLASFGLTPNRVVALGANILVFINLGGIAFYYVRYFRQQTSMQSIENWIARYLPLYSCWTIIVTFILPVLFSFK